MPFEAQGYNHGATIVRAVDDMINGVGAALGDLGASWPAQGLASGSNRGFPLWPTLTRAPRLGSSTRDNGEAIPVPGVLIPAGRPAWPWTRKGACLGYRN
jgi:hypothetical protein